MTSSSRLIAGAAMEDRTRETRPILRVVRQLAGSAGGSGSDGPGREASGRFGAGSQFRSVDHRAATEVEVRVGSAEVGLLAALEGDVEVSDDLGRWSISGDDVMVLARPGRVKVRWSAGAQELTLKLPRSKLQGSASAALGDARRLSNTGQMAISLDRSKALQAAISDLEYALDAFATMTRAAGQGLEATLVRALVAALVDAAAVDEVFPRQRAVSEAMRRVGETPGRIWNAAGLAVSVGVTVPFLRRGFSECLDQSIGAYLLGVRLDGARRSLAGAYDSRSIAAIGVDAGFRTPGAFSRAYVRRFGETPTVTRARAVRDAGTPTRRRETKPDT